MSFLPTAAALAAKLPRVLRRHKLMKGWMTLTGESPIQLVLIRDNSFAYADMAEGFLRLIPIEGDFNLDFFHIADALLGRGGTFFDVGANYGLLSFGLAGRHGDCIEFHLFEADPGLVSTIARSQQRYPAMRCTVNAAAVFSQPGTVRFKIDKAHTGASHIGGAEETDCVEVPALTLDSYIAERGIGRIDLLKLDIEGFELSALQGSRDSLAARRIGAVYFEYFEKQLIREGAPDKLIEFLDSVGYTTCFCRASDFAQCGKPSHTLRQDLAGHGLELLPVAGRARPPMTDLLAVPAEHLVALA